MQAQAYEGYFEGGQFYTAGQMLFLPERKRVYITVLDDPVKPDTSADWAEELMRMIKEDTSEKLRMEDFPRMDLGREAVTFTDKE